MVGFLLPKATFDSADEADALAIAICHASHRQSARAIARAVRREVAVAMVQPASLPLPTCSEGGARVRGIAPQARRIRPSPRFPDP